MHQTGLADQIVWYRRRACDGGQLVIEHADEGEQVVALVLQGKARSYKINWYDQRASCGQRAKIQKEFARFGMSHVRGARRSRAIFQLLPTGH
jgi:hypothetical protein